MKIRIEEGSSPNDPVLRVDAETDEERAVVARFIEATLNGERVHPTTASNDMSPGAMYLGIYSSQS